MLFGRELSECGLHRSTRDQDLTTHYGHHQNKGRSGSVDTMGLRWTGKGLIVAVTELVGANVYGFPD